MTEQDLAKLSESEKELYSKIKEILSKDLDLVDNLADFYSVINKLSYLINNFYTDIECKSGCSRCCKFYGSPQLYKFEWDNIISYLEKNMDNRTMMRVRAKLKDNILFLKEKLENNHDYFQPQFNASVFFIAECPFLYQNKCSIYEVRPLICRMFGNTYLKRENKEAYKNVYACAEEQERWKKEIEINKSLPLLPRNDYLESKIIKLAKTKEDEYYNTIIYWLSDYLNEY